MSKSKDIPIYRIALLGPAGVGKTQILNQFVNNSFSETYESTFDDLRPYKRLLNLGTEKNPMYCLLIIEDIFPISHPMIEAGGEETAVKKKYKDILDNVSKQGSEKDDKKQSKVNANKQIYGYIFVFDVTLTGSEHARQFKQLESVVKFIQNAETRGVNGDFQTKKVLVGNKKEGVTESELAGIKQGIKDLDIPVHFVSAKFNEDITSMFQDLCKEIQEDPKILTLEEEWNKEMSEENKEDDKTGVASGFKKPVSKNQAFEDNDEDDSELYGDRIVLQDDFQSYPKYEPQGMDTKSCNMF